MALDNLYSFYSKSVAYHDECVALQHRLSLVEKEKSQTSEELDEARQQINSLREEMEVSIKNYESQLRLMTEHVADLNDKLMAMSLDKELNSPNSSNKVRSKFIALSSFHYQLNFNHLFSPPIEQVNNKKSKK